MSRVKKTSDAQSDRLRTWILEHYENRGKFTKLESDSLIKSTKWKDMFYGRQNATEEMLNFVNSASTNDHDWIVTGLRDGVENVFFGTYGPNRHDCATITSRMNWVIKELTSPHGKRIFDYLSDISQLVGEKISADAWAKVVMSRSEATPEMLKVVSSRRPIFTVWMLTGDAYTQCCQVDPSSLESIKKWKKDCTTSEPQGGTH